MTLKATKASSLVLSTLNGRERRGRVHSVYRRTVNVLCDDMTWVSLHPADVPLHAYCVAIEGWSSSGDDGFLGACVGESVSVDHTRIMLGKAKASIDLEKTEVWQSRLDPVYGLEPARLVRMGRILRGLLGEVSTESWFLGVVDGQSRPLREPLDTLIRTKISGAVSQLHDSWISGGLDRTLEAMGLIMGLGLGLTPGGDDFLTGFLGASYCFAHDDKFREAVFCNIASPLGRTSLPAFFMLKAALAGHYPESLADLLHALGDSDTYVVKSAVNRLSGLGATSGHDMLAGVLAWFEAAGLCGVTHETHCH
ncbi:MAG: DUF2877 domain-containing protein [Candidatus Eisenbacteria bacterium]